MTVALERGAERPERSPQLKVRVEPQHSRRGSPDVVDVVDIIVVAIVVEGAVVVVVAAGGQTAAAARLVAVVEARHGV
jgi:hypothetical protein